MAFPLDNLLDLFRDTHRDEAGADGYLRTAALDSSGNAFSNTNPLSVNSPYRSQTATFTAPDQVSPTIDVSTSPLKNFSIQVTSTATAWDFRLEGSLNGTSFTTILAHTNTTASGITIFHGNGTTPILFFRARSAGLVGGSGITVILGTQ